MFADHSENEKEQIRDIINRLLIVNILVKDSELELYQLAKRHRAVLGDFFKALGWSFVIDDRHDCVFVHSPEAMHRLRLSKEESIWILILRLLYQEKRSELALSEFPVASLREIRSKYATFQIPFVNKTKLQDLVKLAAKYQLLSAIDSDIRSDDSRFTLYHSLLHAVSAEKVEQLYQRVARYLEEGGAPNEVAEEAEIN